MGIFRDLVSNYANSKIQEQQQKMAYNVGLGDILTTLIQNPDTDAATYAKASAFYQDLLGKHGGKQGKELQAQIAQFLGAYGAARERDRALGNAPQDGTQPQGPTQPQQPGAATNTPPMTGGVGTQPGGVGQGWNTSATPATAAGTRGQAGAGGQAGAPAAGGAQDGRQPGEGGARSGFGKVLGGLAGVGKEMLGIPKEQAGMLIPTPQQIQRLYGPTAVGTAKEKERADIAAGRMERDEYVRRQDADVAAGLQTPDERNENIRDFDRMTKPPSSRTEEAQTLSTAELKSTGEIVPVWVSKRGQRLETLDHKPIDLSDVRAVGTPIDPKATGRLKERIDIERILRTSKNPDELAAAKTEKAYMDSQAESAASMAQIRARQIQSASAIVPGTEEFKVAQDLAYGKLTYDGFKGLISYRDSDRRLAVYYKATQLNPDFNQAEFEAGFRFFARPQTRQQLGAMDNVQAATDDMIRLSDAAKRGGTPLMNRFELPAGYMLGNRAYSNFQTALTAYADELSGALGFGSTTDMTRQLGIKMSDGNVDPETFRSNLQIVQNFIDRKRNGLLGEMSVYGQPGGTIPEIHDMDEYNALPPGSKWRKPSDPPTTERTKPKR